MSDVFNRANDSYGGSIASDGARITFTALAQGGVGLLTQSLQVNYRQMVNRVYEVGTDRIYLVGGRTDGGIGMNRIIGPAPIQYAFYRKFGDVCQAGNNNIDVAVGAGCGTAVGGLPPSALSRFGAKFNVLTSIGLSVAASDMVINEALGLIFGSLQLDGNQVGTSTGAALSANVAQPFSILGSGLNV